MAFLCHFVEEHYLPSVSGESVTLFFYRCYWRPPDSGKFKFNIDATWNVDSSIAGGLFRDHQGQVRFFFTRKLVHSPSAEHAKIVAIREGFRLAERFGYPCFVVESDCK